MCCTKSQTLNDFYEKVLHCKQSDFMHLTNAALNVRIDTMKIFKSANIKSFFVGAFASSLVFVFFTFVSPNLFAQGQSGESAAKSRQYQDLIRTVFDFVEQNYIDEVDSQKMYEGALKGIMDSLEDPYTTYMDSTQMRSLNDTTVGSFGGVGLSITKPILSTPEKPAYVEVVSPIEDTPGAKAGIQSGDLIISIDEKPTQDITMDEVLALLRGKKGDPVDLIIRRGKNVEFPVTLVRAIIEVPTVKFGMIEDDIGYLRIIEFTPQTPERVQDALDLFTAANFSSLIIDLRNNPGGLITSVVDVADKFIDNGPIVSTKSRHSYENTVFTAKPSKTTVPDNLPIVVLINSGSASASEILAGALKDDHLGYLIGENTFGKGSVQQVVPLPNSDGIKITMARYYTPSDSNIDKVGIPPDREVLFPELNEDEEKAYSELMNSNIIADFIAEHPAMSEQEITNYAKTLESEYALSSRLLRRMVWLESYRLRTQPLYDLEFDVQLSEAVTVLRTESFTELMKSTKTISELQAQDEETLVANAKIIEANANAAKAIDNQNE